MNEQTTAERVLIVDENESIMVVDRDVIIKVDEQRGELSRPEYLNNLIYNQVSGTGQEYLRREEFLQFAANIKALLSSFLEFAISCTLGLPTSEDGASLRTLASELHSLNDNVRLNLRPEKQPADQPAGPGL